MAGDLASQYSSLVEEFVESAGTYNGYNRAKYYSMLDFDLTGKSLLDIGCGDGYDLDMFRRRGAVVHGIDASSEMVRRARVRVPSGQVSQGLMEDIPYRSSAFDFVVSKYAVQASVDVPGVLTEMDRVLRPGGMLAYLAVHPLRQFLEKRKHPKDYFIQEVVDSVFFEGRLSVREPTHTLNEYLSPWFFTHYDLLHFEECPDFPSSERVDGDTYPCFFMVKARKRL
ncbi:MAG: class I SAM-dependent methyltransferase [Nanoarchaeota archaeon]